MASKTVSVIKNAVSRLAMAGAVSLAAGPAAADASRGIAGQSSHWMDQGSAMLDVVGIIIIIAGVITLWSGANKLKEYTDTDGRTPIKHAIVRGVVGSLLLSFGVAAGVGGGTLFKDGDTLQVQGGQQTGIGRFQSR